MTRLSIFSTKLTAGAIHGHGIHSRRQRQLRRISVRQNRNSSHQKKVTPAQYLRAQPSIDDIADKVGSLSPLVTDNHHRCMTNQRLATDKGFVAAHMSAAILSHVGGSRNRGVPEDHDG